MRAHTNVLDPASVENSRASINRGTDAIDTRPVYELDQECLA